MLRKDWRNFLVTEDEAEELEQAFILFEEDDGSKNYDLCKGVFSSLEVAKEYAEAISGKEPLYIADYKEYVNGNYDYIYVIK